MKKKQPEHSDGIIEFDSPLGTVLGFTSDVFEEDCYLWLTNGAVVISFIACRKPGRGDFSRLAKAIREAGYRMEIPTPSGIMESIASRWNMKQEWRDDGPLGEPVEVWSEG